MEKPVRAAYGTARIVGPRQSSSCLLFCSLHGCRSFGEALAHGEEKLAKLYFEVSKEPADYAALLRKKESWF